MGSAALAAVVPYSYPDKATRISGKGPRSTNKKHENLQSNRGQGSLYYFAGPHENGRTNSAQTAVCTARTYKAVLRCTSIFCSHRSRPGRSPVDVDVGVVVSIL